MTLEELWQVLDAADPSSSGSSGRRRLLADTLDELASLGLVELPSSRSYDRTANPPLPRFVTRPAVAAPTRKSTAVMWHPKLAWAASARLTADQEQLLVKVNRWLFRSRGDLVVPLRERSLEILGDEKALDGKLATSLFAEGRLSLDLLRARRAVPRLYTERVGVGDVLLVVENSDTFDSLVRVLTDRPGRIGSVGWGAGGGFEASVLSISPDVREILYFGDLDRDGLRIPANASRLAVLSGLPPVQPATPLYDALFEVGQPQPGQPALSESVAGPLVEWLDLPQREPVRALLASGRRLAQEAVGLAYLQNRAVSSTAPLL
ncbi:hypothetical protein LFM09_03480 [Lentzea alba]|uniref:hypothetical protein n=1 Tax=Lentzea alba TaxID=2714351 RepID=UPI0039BEF049